MLDLKKISDGRVIDRDDGIQARCIGLPHCTHCQLEAEVVRLRKLEGTDDHPEHRCDRCRGRNISSWYTDSDIWNRVAGNFSILCPICFTELAAEVGMEPTAWRLSMKGDDPEVSKLRVALHARLEESAGLKDEVVRLRKQLNYTQRILGRAATIASIRKAEATDVEQAQGAVQ